MHDSCEQDTDQVPTLQRQGQELRRALSRIDRKIATEQERLRRVETRLAALSRNEALAA